MCILHMTNLSCREVRGKYVSEKFTLTIDLILKTAFFVFVPVLCSCSINTLVNDLYQMSSYNC